MVNLESEKLTAELCALPAYEPWKEGDLRVYLSTDADVLLYGAELLRGGEWEKLELKVGYGADYTEDGAQVLDDDGMPLVTFSTPDCEHSLVIDDEDDGGRVFYINLGPLPLSVDENVLLPYLSFSLSIHQQYQRHGGCRRTLSNNSIRRDAQRLIHKRSIIDCPPLPLFVLYGKTAPGQSSGGGLLFAITPAAPSEVRG